MELSKFFFKNEFSSKINSAELHRFLAERKMRRDETVHEYFLTMKEIANRGAIEDEALMQYVIDGIRDEHSNELILYGAETISEFKTKLRIYSGMKIKISKPPNNAGISNNFKAQFPQNRNNDVENSNATSQKRQIKCFNCGRPAHKSADSLKCFRCNLFGHKGTNCPKYGQSSENTSRTTCAVLRVATE